MNLFKSLASALITVVVITTTAHANLIQNGSFEEFDAVDVIGGKSQSTWRFYSEIDGWEDTQNIEIWKSGLLGVEAADGDYLLELNAHGSDLTSAYSIFQEFATTAGTAYDLIFASQKRSGNANQKFSVSVDGENGNDFSEIISSHVAGDWTYFNYSFTATSDLSTLTFSSLDKFTDKTGNLFDDVSITTSVPEPNVIMFLVLAIAGLVIHRKQSK